MGDYMVLHKPTGEVVADNVADYRTDEQVQAANYYKQKKESYAADTLAGRYFTFMFLSEVKKEEYTLANLSRLGALVVLSTYVQPDSEGSGVSLLPFNTVKGDIARVLKVSKTQATNVWADLEKLGLAYREEDKMFLNANAVYRGSTNRTDIAKVWHMNTRQLLDNGCKISDIGLLFLTAPYIHRHTNFMCTNPDARYDEEIQHIGLNELATLIKVDPKTLRSKFKKMVIMYEGKRVPLYIKANSQLSNKDRYIINPLVINRGMTNSGIAELFKKI